MSDATVCRTTITFSVPGIPRPQGSKEFKGFKGGKPILTEASAYLGQWRERVALVAHNAMVCQGGCRLITDEPVAVELEFVMPRPTSCPKRSTPPAIKRPDLDKLSRAIFDAITDTVAADESQVVDLHATKRTAELGETPGVTVTVTLCHPPTDTEWTLL
jgi:crossover junction endodeoxyribonuclease RusA